MVSDPNVGRLLLVTFLQIQSKDVHRIYTTLGLGSHLHVTYNVWEGLPWFYANPIAVVMQEQSVHDPDKSVAHKGGSWILTNTEG